MVSTVSIRSKPDHQSRMINQMLFGELCEIITKKHSHWCRVKLKSDDSEGWCLSYQLKFITGTQFEKFQLKRAFALDVSQSVIGDDQHLPILLGSTLPHYDGISFKVPGQTMRYSGQVYFPDQSPFRMEMLIKIARKYLYAPYVPGGRSPFGIDEGGLIHMVYLIFGFGMPRSVYQQSQEGEILHFTSEARAGDLAFFEDESGKIIHGGIVIEEGKVLHAFGHVRIDLLDHFGLFNKELKSYTHRLRFVKRVISY